MQQGRSTGPAPDARRSPERSADEAALLQRIAAGDRLAFEALYRGYYPRLTRFLERVIRRPHSIEEILNDAMLVVWRKAASFNGRSKVSTWIFSIAYRKALKALRQFDEPVESDDEAFESTIPGPEGLMMQRQLTEQMMQEIGRMSFEHRTVIELTYYHGCAYREIAEIMACPVDTVKTRMFHARRKLRLALADRREDLQ
ncbi:MAG TPA: sigma-70 family RNA polymerase sigma factor [Burkholderiaceae bacterium]|nr:sigma-70 family RNA polymerase sigma factor [Burkholderiaceae bacterium]